MENQPVAYFQAIGWCFYEFVRKGRPVAGEFYLSLVGPKAFKCRINDDPDSIRDIVIPTHHAREVTTYERLNKVTKEDIIHA